MAAPTSGRQKTKTPLANGEPSTHTTRMGRTLAVRDSDRVMGVASPGFGEVLMRRREVIAGIAIVLAALTARATAQPAEPFRRRIGALVSAPADDPEYVANLTAFRQQA